MHARDVVCCLGCLGAVVAVLIIGMYAKNGSDGSSAGSSGRGGSAGPSYDYPAPAKQRCPSCRNGKVSCNCGNGWVSDHNGQPQAHHLCFGSGELTCQMCHGTGFR